MRKRSASAGRFFASPHREKPAVTLSAPILFRLFLHSFLRVAEFTFFSSSKLSFSRLDLCFRPFARSRK